MKKVFISYSRADYVDESGQLLENSQVGAIVKALIATNCIDVWIDINAKYSGKYFTSVLAKKILWADKVLFLSSKNSNESEWVSKEILFAHDNNKEVLPVRLDESNYNVDFALILTGIDYIEYFKSPKHKIKDIIENILEDSQEISNIITPINALSDNPVSNQKERKGCLSLNVNFRGCALSMTILMGVLLLIGIFIPFGKRGTYNDYIVYNNDRDNLNAPQEVITSPEIDLWHRDSVEHVENSTPKTTATPPSKSRRHNEAKNRNSIPQDRINSKKMNKNESETYIVQNEEEPKEGSTSHVPSGAVAGPRSISNRVSAFSSDSYQITFKGGEFAMVMVSGEGDTDLDVFVYDSEGNLVASDKDSADDGVIKWTPRRTEKYRIVINNKGNVYNNYTIRTNQ